MAWRTAAGPMYPLLTRRRSRGRAAFSALVADRVMLLLPPAPPPGEQRRARTLDGPGAVRLAQRPGSAPASLLAVARLQRCPGAPGDRRGPGGCHVAGRRSSSAAAFRFVCTRFAISAFPLQRWVACAAAMPLRSPA